MVENYGDSELAKRFGVTRYPAIFVDDVLVATPKDFGFFGKGEGKAEGRYAPLKSAASHERFRADLARMLELVLAGDKEAARARAASADADAAAARCRRSRSPTSTAGPSRARTWPARSCSSSSGPPGARPAAARSPGSASCSEARDGTWSCSPRRSSPRRRTSAASGTSSACRCAWAMGTPELARAFGDVSAVPTLFVFDRQGRTRGAFYGAPPSLHAEAEQALAAALD